MLQTSDLDNQLDYFVEIIKNLITCKSDGNLQHLL